MKKILLTISTIITILFSLNLRVYSFEEKNENYLIFIDVNELTLSLLKEDTNSDLCQNLNAANYTKLQAMMQNSCKELLQESQQTGSLLPVVGLTLPLLKL